MLAIVLKIPNPPDDVPLWLIIPLLVYVIFGSVIWRRIKRAAGRERDER